MSEQGENRQESTPASDEQSPGIPSQPRLPLAGLLISASGLAISVVLFLSVLVRVVPVAWNAEVLPWGTSLVLVPFCISGLVVSIYSAYVHRNTLSYEGCVLGLLATVASLCAWGIIVLTAVAHHPA